MNRQQPPESLPTHHPDARRPPTKKRKRHYYNAQKNPFGLPQKPLQHWNDPGSAAVAMVYDEQEGSAVTSAISLSPRCRMQATSRRKRAITIMEAIRKRKRTRKRAERSRTTRSGTTRPSSTRGTLQRPNTRYRVPLFADDAHTPKGLPRRVESLKNRTRERVTTVHAHLPHHPSRSIYN